MTCGANQYLNPKGMCACNNGYYNNGTQCVLGGGFLARSYSYEVNILPNG